DRLFARGLDERETHVHFLRGLLRASAGSAPASSAWEAASAGVPPPTSACKATSAVTWPPGLTTRTMPCFSNRRASSGEKPAISPAMYGTALRRNFTMTVDMQSPCSAPPRGRGDPVIRAAWLHR